MATEEIIAKYILDVKDLQAKVKVVEAELRKTSEAATKSQSAISSVTKKNTDVFQELGKTIVAAFAVERIVSFGLASVKAFQEAELTAKKLQVAVGVNGGLASDFDRLIKQSKQLESISIFSDDDIQAVQTIGLQFGLTTAQVEKLLPVVVDFASATGQDLRSAFDSVLRGVEGQARGLKLYGVTLQDGATRTENLATITDQLTTKFKDQASIVAQTSEGALKQYENRVNNLQEEIGEKLAPKILFLKESFFTLADGIMSVVNASEDLFDSETSILNPNNWERSGNAIVHFNKEFKKTFDIAIDASKDRTTENILIDITELMKKQATLTGDQRTDALATIAALQQIYSERLKISKEEKISFDIKKATVDQLEKEKKLLAGNTDTTSRDAVDAINKELELRKKAAEEESKLRDARIAKEKEASLKLLELKKKTLDDLAIVEAGKDPLKLIQAKYNAELINAVDVYNLKKKSVEDRANLAETLAAIEQKYEKETTDVVDEQKTKQADFIKKNIADISKWVADANERDRKKEEEDAKKTAEKIKEIKLQIAQEIAEGLLNILFDSARQENELAQQRVSEQLDRDTQSVDATIAKLEEKKSRGLISEKEFVKEKKKLEDQKAKDELAAKVKIDALKHQQDLANQRQKLFDIAIATAKNAVEQPGFFGALIPFWIALGAAQAAIVLASPLPKYFKGTEYLQRGNNPHGRDTIPFMGHEGEAIIPTEQNRRHPGLAKAWITNDLDKYFLKHYVSPALKQQKDVHDKNIFIRNSININEGSLAKKIAAELAWEMRGEKTVNISNIKKIAEAMKPEQDKRTR